MAAPIVRLATGAAVKHWFFVNTVLPVLITGILAVPVDGEPPNRNGTDGSARR